MSPDLPEPRHVHRPCRDADSGRGLVILDLVADRWGGCAIGEGSYGPGGKTIWFELALGGRPPTDPGGVSALVAWPPSLSTSVSVCVPGPTPARR
ncbi:hypothetical protein ACFXCZ_16955 [Streptomyces sp. NPDC059396]|uniref:hypothetical protein n=1 Tax=Streptomyces sp. NPDC059396 TaxID=3346819 RepID=UPI0036C580F0